MQPAADSRCARCRTPHHSQYCPLDPDRFASGDIWGISEATRVPIQLILYRNRPAAARNSREAGLSSKWSVAPKNTGSGKYWEYNARPCIMMSAGDPYSSNGHPICLLATFHGAAVLQDLPEVLRRFCVPISPHPLSAQDGVHLHITPEWPKADAWVIAWLYVTYSPLQGRWQNKAPGSSWNSSYKLDDEAFAKLLDLCRERRKQWEELCTQDKGLRKRCVVEYKAMNARIKREAGLVKTRKEKDEPVASGSGTSGRKNRKAKGNGSAEGRPRSGRTHTVQTLGNDTGAQSAYSDLASAASNAATGVMLDTVVTPKTPPCPGATGSTAHTTVEHTEHIVSPSGLEVAEASKRRYASPSGEQSSSHPQDALQDQSRSFIADIKRIGKMIFSTDEGIPRF